MEDNIKTYFESIFYSLIENERIIFPNKEIINTWQNVINEWINDDSIPLFVRKGSEIRGTIIEFDGRNIITTDNTPAHWVFKNIVLERLNFSPQEILELINSNKFPISFIRKKTEYETLLDGMVADNKTRLNNAGWKLAHIIGIAMKRGKNITIDDYKKHHSQFLALSNMYLIDKKFSGLAEVNLFNEIIIDYKINVLKI
ncbi:hypothetical protein [Flavobacterium microcysteis]